MNYILIIVGSFIFGYFISKKLSKPKIKIVRDKKQEKIIDQQNAVMFYISDGIHNIHKYNIDKEIIGDFFAVTRTLCSNIEIGNYDDFEYEKILDFIKNDWHDYCHGRFKNLNIKKYEALINKNA